MRGSLLGDDRVKSTRWRAAVWRQFERIANSEPFAASHRLTHLLRHLVAETLEGRGVRLNESSVGNAVYRRNPPYDPRIDSTVRVEVRRLRRKLEDYYAGEGRSDSLRIDVPVGSYVPLFSEARPNPEILTRPGPAVVVADTALFEPGGGALIALMPLRPLNRGARAEAFADDLTAEIAYVVGQEPGITVVAGDQLRQARDEGRGRDAIAGEIGVDLFVDGTVKTTGDTVRVTIDVSYANGIVAWSDRIDAPRMRGLRLQEMIATTLVSHVRIDNSLARQREVRPRPVALESNARVNRARLLLGRGSLTAIRQALADFEMVAAGQPGYARGHSGIADCLADLYRLDVVGAEAVAARAVEAADRALACDPRSVEALTARATVAALFERRPDDAFRWFDAAVSFGGGARAFRGIALTMASLGRFEAAEQALARARDLEPISVLIDGAEAVCRFHAGAFDRFPSEARKGRRGASPMSFEATVWTALAQALAGRADEALALLPDLEAGCGDFPAFRLSADEVRVRLGLASEPGERLAEATAYGRATFFAALGRRAEASAELERAVATREAATFWLAADPRLAGLMPP